LTWPYVYFFRFFRHILSHMYKKARFLYTFWTIAPITGE
jgi:hypothetical protein